MPREIYERWLELVNETKSQQKGEAILRYK